MKFWDFNSPRPISPLPSASKPSTLSHSHETPKRRPHDVGDFLRLWPFHVDLLESPPLSIQPSSCLENTTSSWQQNTTNQHKSRRTHRTHRTVVNIFFTNMTCFNFFSVNVTLSRDIQPGNLVISAIGFDFWKYRNLKTRKPCHIKVSIKGFAISASNLERRDCRLQRV